VEPDSFYKEKDAEEYEATVFTCPQCGGQILSEDTTAATFCSFCGAATILDSRISKERRPDYIIPFTKNEDECRHAYMRMMRRAVFAPNDLKDESHIEKFRGIYMPYWIYSFEKKGKISFSGSKSHRRGDYLITKHYRMESELDAEYKGLAYDASSAFSDNLSAAVAPFDMKRSRTFVPAFLSGFYADTSDVANYTYKSDAADIVVGDSCKRLLQQSVCRRYHVDSDYELKSVVYPDKSETKLAMLPVWFVAYRNGDRVCYAAVNGQTGKAAADIPIDFKKYLIGSVLLALPLFFLLNLLFTFTPQKLLVAVAILGFLCALIANGQMARLLEREAGEGDKGRAFAESVSNRRNQNYTDDMTEGRRKLKERIWGSGNSKSLKTFMIFVVIITGFQLLSPLFFHLIFSDFGLSFVQMFLILVVAVCVFMLGDVIKSFLEGIGFSFEKKSEYVTGYWKEKLPTLAKPLAGIVVVIFILIMNPVSDWYYYLGAFVCMTMVLCAIIDIIKRHNMLSTRRLPQFNSRGGDERV